MTKIILCWVLLTSIFFPQNFNQDSSNIFHSPENIKKFADFLFCSKDYLRAIEEYEKYLNSYSDDTIVFKIGLAYSRMQKYLEAENSFKQVRSFSQLFSESRLQIYKASFQDDVLHFRNNLNGNRIIESNHETLFKLKNFSYFFTNNKLPGKELFLSVFNEDEKEEINDFYKFKINPQTKSPVIASILSAVVPGLGKIYSDQISDGITAFIATGLLTFLAYDNFHANHKFRGWLFTGLGGLFYAGNIYGSAAAAQIYNAKLLFNFNASLKVYLDSKNYFIPKINFCN